MRFGSVPGRRHPRQPGALHAPPPARAWHDRPAHDLSVHNERFSPLPLNPQALTLWRGPRWTLALLLACLGMLGPFSIDTYLPAFSGIAQSIGATPVQMQQTLSAYLAGFAVMNLFHGALSDSVGRRPVVLVGIGVFTLASIGCALSDHITTLVFWRAVQGLSAGAGMVVSRAVIRDLYPPADAQKVMSQVTLFFGVAPAIAPLIGGLLFVSLDWHAIFWFLALIGLALWLGIWRFLPETLHIEQRQTFSAANLMRGYVQLGANPRFLALALASGVPFNGMFLYVLASPVFLGEHLGLGPTQFFWLFVLTIGGIMGGAWLSGRLAGRKLPRHQVRQGFLIMITVSVVNVVLNLAFTPAAWWALWPISLFAFGWAITAPVVTLMVLDLVPERRGMASSLQAFVASLANAVTAGAIAPLVMHSTVWMAFTSAALMTLGAIAWIWVNRQIKAER
jgi:MFS transporter, DHA1 family, multidrug resistance protein